MAPLFDVDARCAFSLLWPTRDVDDGDVVAARAVGGDADAAAAWAAELARLADGAGAGAAPEEALGSVAELNRELLDFSLRPALERAMTQGASY